MNSDKLSSLEADSFGYSSVRTEAGDSDRPSEIFMTVMNGEKANQSIRPSDKQQRTQVL